MAHHSIRPAQRHGVDFGGAGGVQERRGAGARGGAQSKYVVYRKEPAPRAASGRERAGHVPAPLRGR